LLCVKQKAWIDGIMNWWSNRKWDESFILEPNWSAQRGRVLRPVRKRFQEEDYMNTKTLFGILTITAALAMNGRSQVYQFTAPISGGMTLSVGASDVNFGSHYGAGGTGTNWMAFNTLSETVYLDTVSNTPRQVGTISYTPSAANIQFQITSESNIIGNATVYLAPSTGTLSFDTGPQGLYNCICGDCGPYGLFYGSTFWSQGLPMSGS
jgi:hypothetical protein